MRHKKSFLRKCSKAHDLRKGDMCLNINKKYFNQSPGMLTKTVDILMDDRIKEQKKRSAARIKLKKLSENDGGDELDLDPSKFNVDCVFDDELQKAISTFW